MGEYNVVICIDPSAFSENAFNDYCENISRPNHTVHLVHVMEWWGDGAEKMSPANLDKCLADTNDLAKNLDAKYTGGLKTFGLTGHFHKLEGRHGHVWHNVLEYAESVNAKLIVTGCRGAGKVRRTLMGSNSDSLVHHSHIPVLVHKH